MPTSKLDHGAISPSWSTVSLYPLPSGPLLIMMGRADAPVGYNYGLPLSHFILAKQLENCTSLRSDSPLYDQNSKRRHLVFDFCLAIFGPIVGFLVSLTCRLTRFNIVEGFGPVPGVYWDTWGVVWVAVSQFIPSF